MVNTLFTTVILTLLSLLAFAANSVLCRMALGEELIDAASFTVIRLFSGIVMLGLIVLLKGNNKSLKKQGSWWAAFMLFLYAVCFSFAYIHIDTATGALVLFGFVQITMITVSIFKGYHLHSLEWLGLILAFAGFIYLIFPNLHSPSLWGFGLMAIAGIAWGFYTISGVSSLQPTLETTANFIRTLPLLVALAVVAWSQAHISSQGLWLAVASGALASGLGYALWYMALRNLSNTVAASAQLLVPVVAAFGGVIFYAESLSVRLFIAFFIVLGGIALIITARFRVPA